MYSTKYFTAAILLIFALILNANAQEKKNYKVGCIAFYNLENLFDTIDQPDVRDGDFLPDGDYKWDTEKYFNKLDNMSKVIAQIGNEFPIDGPAIVGVCEVENKSVLDDLVAHKNIADRNYQIVHYDSPDRRGIDVALLYKPDVFKVYNSKSVELKMEDDPDFISRDQLVVSGLFGTDTMHVIVNHWPSRSGGEKRSRPKRNAAAKLSRQIVDSLYTLNPNAKVIVMGDLNDDPTNHSLVKHLKAKGNKNKIKKQELFNPMFQMHKKGIGSLAYRDSWNLFDQIVISEPLLNDQESWHFYTAKVFNKKFLVQKDGRYKGYPLRTTAGGVYRGGFSDHFPTYIFLLKEEK